MHCQHQKCVSKFGWKRAVGRFPRETRFGPGLAKNTCNRCTKQSSVFGFEKEADYLHHKCARMSSSSIVNFVRMQSSNKMTAKALRKTFWDVFLWQNQGCRQGSKYYQRYVEQRIPALRPFLQTPALRFFSVSLPRHALKFTWKVPRWLSARFSLAIGISAINATIALCNVVHWFTCMLKFVFHAALCQDSVAQYALLVSNGMWSNLYCSESFKLDCKYQSGVDGVFVHLSLTIGHRGLFVCYISCAWSSYFHFNQTEVDCFADLGSGGDFFFWYRRVVKFSVKSLYICTPSHVHCKPDLCLINRQWKRSARSLQQAWLLSC